MNKTMLILSRGCSARTKNILHDLERLLHTYKENKFDQKNSLGDLRELMDINDCTSTIYFESTKRINYTWVSTENGPSVRFITYNLFTIRDLMFESNCSLERNHKLVFDCNFDDKQELIIVKNLFTKVFTFKVENEAVVNEKDDCGVDRFICFYYFDEKIWMRVYVVDGGVLKEIGPRMVLEVDKILENCFSGKIIFKKYTNDRYLENKLEVAGDKENNDINNTAPLNKNEENVLLEEIKNQEENIYCIRDIEVENIENKNVVLSDINKHKETVKCIENEHRNAEISVNENEHQNAEIAVNEVEVTEKNAEITVNEIEVIEKNAEITVNEIEVTENAENNETNTTLRNPKTIKKAATPKKVITTTKKTPTPRKAAAPRKAATPKKTQTPKKK